MEILIFLISTLAFCWAFGFQIDNGIPIDSSFDDSSDEEQELLALLLFLESLGGAEDVLGELGLS
jgi:hypothetical protein